MRIGFGPAVALSVGLLASACDNGGTSTSPGGQTIILVSIDAVRPDLPRADVLAASLRNAVAFDPAYTPVPMTRPAAAAMLTGIGPDHLGVRDDVWDGVPSSAPHVAAQLKAAGWRTAAFVDTPHASHGSGLERGFELFDGPEGILVGPERHAPRPRPVSDLRANVESWLGSLEASARAFVWIHLSSLKDAEFHGREDGTKSPGDRYREARARFETELAALLDAVGRGRSVQGFLVGTSGTMLGEDGAWGSAYWLREETLSVPFIWWGSPLPEAKRGSTRQVSLLDVAPTILSLAGVPVPSAMEGRDLTATGDAERPFAAWTWAPDDELAWPPLTAVRENGAWRVLAWPESQSLPRPAGPRRRALSDSAARAVAEAGISIDPSRDEGSPALDDPNSFLTEYLRIRGAIADERPVLSRRGSKRLVESYPGNLGAMVLRLYVLATRGRARSSPNWRETRCDASPVVRKPSTGRGMRRSLRERSKRRRL
jgi:Arylsulfatase A and related enzymes